MLTALVLAISLAVPGVVIDASDDTANPGLPELAYGDAGALVTELNRQLNVAGFNADDGNYYYFYKAAVTVLGSPTPVTPTGERFMGASLSAGQKFRIVALHPDDAYYPDRVNILGKHCHVGDTMNNQGPGWYSGQAYCSDGTDYYFFKVGVVLE